MRRTSKKGFWRENKKSSAEQIRVTNVSDRAAGHDLAKVTQCLVPLHETNDKSLPSARD